MTSQQKALIVDDSRAACAVLARLLKSFGLESDSVNCAADAFEYLEANTPSVIFMDHSMPDMDGLEAVTLIQRHKSWVKIPIFMFTARSDAAFLKQVENSGAMGIVPKSLEQSVIKNALSKIDLLSRLSVKEPDNPKVKESEPSQEQKFQVWLESFIENKITPALAFRLDKSTRELREEILQNGDKLHRTSLQFHMQQQKRLVKQIEAERDSLIAAYEWNQQRFSRRLSAVFGSLFVVLLIAAGYLLMNERQTQQQLAQQITSLQNLQQELSQSLVDVSTKLAEVKAESGNSRPVLMDTQGDVVAELVSYDQSYSFLQARSSSGYLFTLNNMEVESLPQEIYFLAQDCFGTRWVESTPGIIYADEQSQLWYTPKDNKPELNTYFSKLNALGECEAEEGSAELVQLFRNEPELTQLPDGPFQVGSLQ